MATITRAEAVAYRVYGAPSRLLISAADAALMALPPTTACPLNRAEEGLRDALRNRPKTPEARAALAVLTA